MRMAKAFLLLCAFLCLCSLAFAEVPKMINYQGKITTPEGALIDTTISMTFVIYTDSIGTDSLWSETQSSVVVEKGVFSVLLGSVNPIPDSVFTGEIRYLEVKAGDDSEMTPRKAIVSMGYAFRSAKTDTAEYALFATTDNDWDTDTSGFNIYRLTGRVGIGTTEPQDKLHVVSVAGADARIGVTSIGGYHAVAQFKSTGSQSVVKLSNDLPLPSAPSCNLWFYRSADPNKGWVAGTDNGFKFRIGYGTGPYEGAAITNAKDGLTGIYIDTSGIGTTSSSYKLDVDGYVQAYGYYTGDIIFQKNKQKLWRMFEDEDGLYLENLKTGKIYRFVLQEVENK